MNDVISIYEYETPQQLIWGANQVKHTQEWDLK